MALACALYGMDLPCRNVLLNRHNLRISPAHHALLYRNCGQASDCKRGAERGMQEEDVSGR